MRLRARRNGAAPLNRQENPIALPTTATATRYRQLKLASMNTGDSMNAIISSAIDEWLLTHPEALEI